MATSGSSDFELAVDDYIEEAFERCGLEVRTGYDLRTAKRSLNLMFADWANRGLNRWTITQTTTTITEAFDENGDKNTKEIKIDKIILPNVNEFVQPILYSIPIQLIAYFVAVKKATDVDQPRNLAKSVTVE